MIFMEWLGPRGRADAGFAGKHQKARLRVRCGGRQGRSRPSAV